MIKLVDLNAMNEGNGALNRDRFILDSLALLRQKQHFPSEGLKRFHSLFNNLNFFHLYFFC